MASWSHHANLGLSIYRLISREGEINLYPIQSTVSLGVLCLQPKVFLVDRRVQVFSLSSSCHCACSTPTGDSPLCAKLALSETSTPTLVEAGGRWHFSSNLRVCSLPSGFGVFSLPPLGSAFSLLPSHFPQLIIYYISWAIWF